MITFYVAGVPTFRFLSLIMFYSVCMHLIKLFILHKLLHILPLPRNFRDEDFLAGVINCLFLTGVLIYTFSPILIWLDIRKFTLYLKKWLLFQVSKFLYNFDL